MSSELSVPSIGDGGGTRDADALLRSVGLAVVKAPVEHAVRRRQDGREVIILRFRLEEASLRGWLEQSFGVGGGPGRAWVTYENVGDALGIGTVPNTWRLSRSKPAGLERERYLLIDDAEPATVIVGICPTLDAVAEDRW
ncbi:hypothetical protein [Brachybacterium fresconis]|uniref:Uncharacterized protein n=1 Tax=Brachybacterium fresconis TaxID=173363 RepID=A0ABS4YP06_9MICO|nr:hypothetical protein [Brachybacterium fresconis]MBP2410529.1 hypothetical protein [Brachybacterium fresconis]